MVTTFHNDTPALTSAQDFSDWERCPRLVQVGRLFQPPNWPVRLALRRYLDRALLRLSGGETAESVAIDLESAFIDEAGTRGFDMGATATDLDHKVYVMTRDYACWLEGAARVLSAEFDAEGLELAGPVEVEGRAIATGAWLNKWEPTHAVTFRIADRVEERETARWAELLTSLLPGVTRITTHTLLLPARTREGRVPSPLCLAYAHPLTGHLRVACRKGEKLAFTSGWKRTGRWELENSGNMISWDEWRAGIDKDEGWDRVSYSLTMEPSTDKEVRRELIRDAAGVLAAIDRPTEAPRKREACERYQCWARGLCYGGAEERQGYRVIGSSLSPEQSTHPVSVAVPQT